MYEGKSIEFKERMTDSFLKTVSAFANYGTGQILFGITDDGKEVGVENPTDFCLNLENKINDSISPRPDFSLSVNKHCAHRSGRRRQAVYLPRKSLQAKRYFKR